MNNREILRLKPEKVRQLINQGEIKLGGDSADLSSIESKPVETTTPVNTPVNTLGGISAKGVGRRRFLVEALALGGFGLSGIGLKTIVDYLDPPPVGLYEKILHSPLAADDLPQGWFQVKSYPIRRLPDNASAIQKLGHGEISSVTAILQIPGKEDDTRYGIPMIDFIVFESSQKAQATSKKYQYPGYKSVSGIGDMAWVDFYNSPPNVMSRCLVVDDNVLITSLVKGDEQTVLNLSKSAIKYLARIEVTPKKP